MKKIFILLITVMLLFGGCSSEEQLGPKVLTLAVFEENQSVAEQVVEFNKNNPEYQIEIVEYSRSVVPQEDGRAKLQREIMSGEGPDIIDFGSFYTTSDITGCYTENLLPYLEKEVQNGENAFFENVLDAFCYQGSLYAVPVSFGMHTFAGSKEVLGDMKQWNISEMMDFYARCPEEMILYPGEMKKDVFATLLTGSMDYYIDWETGSCAFAGEEFQKVMSFANSFPDTIQYVEGESLKQRYLDGKALLLPLYMTDIYDICKAEFIFGEQVSYIGFPVEQSSGTVIIPTGSMLAISISSEHKEIAWEFIYGFLQEEYQMQIENGFPVCKAALEKKLAEQECIEYVTDEAGNSVPLVKREVRFEGEEAVPIYNISKEQAERLITLIEEAEICTAIDYQLYNALLEEAGSYFAGDKTLEQAAEIMQSRALLYVNERVSAKGELAETQPQAEIESGQDATVQDGTVPDVTAPGNISAEAEEPKSTAKPGESTVVYEGEPFMKSVFAVGSDKIYLCGLDEEEEFFLAGMSEGEPSFHRFDIEMPADMRVFRMAVDEAGRCHALWLSVEDVVIGGQTFSQLSFESGYITIMDAEGAVEATIDISSILSQKQVNPYRFAVDREGNYYIDHETEILKISREGELVETIVCEGSVEGLGIGSSGKVYCIYNGENGALVLGCVERGEVSSCAELLRYDAMYTNLCPGLTSELLLYNKEGGVLSYQAGAQAAEIIIAGEALPIMGQKVVGCGFLADGSLCLLEQENGVTRFYYVPTDIL